MDLLLLFLGLACMIVGILGSFLPVVPGLSVSWFGLLLLYATKAVPADYWVIGITLALTIIVSVLDYFIPAKGTKLFGGSSYGIWGTNIGLILGLLSPIPFGFIIGPFVGAFLGELLYDQSNQKRAFKAATGSLIGFLASTFMQFLCCVLFLGIYLTVAWQYKSLLW
jgi:uncharacterized protein YqgC (DUF456 family)